jgi:hypothetical protein
MLSKKMAALMKKGKEEGMSKEGISAMLKERFGSHKGSSSLAQLRARTCHQSHMGISILVSKVHGRHHGVRDR